MVGVMSKLESSLELSYVALISGFVLGLVYCGNLWLRYVEVVSASETHWHCTYMFASLYKPSRPHT